MKRNTIVATIAIAMLTLATGTCAFAGERNAQRSSAVVTNGADVTLMPGTGSDTLRLHFSGAQIITQESSGGLMILKAKGEMLHYRPGAFQLIEGELKPVEVHFRMDGIDQVVVEFGKIDKNVPVILKQGAVMSSQAVM